MLRTDVFYFETDRLRVRWEFLDALGVMLMPRVHLDSGWLL